MGNRVTLDSSIRLEGFFSKNKTTKVILEVGKPSPWRQIGVDIGEYAIPEETLRVHFRLSQCDLDLLLRINEDGGIQEVFDEPHEALTLSYINWSMARPRSMLTEDGRLFHDRELLRQPELVQGFLQYLDHHYQQGRGFHEIYTSLQESRNGH